MSLNVRRMAAVDLATVAELDSLSFSQPWPQKAFWVELSNPNARCWVSEQDGRLVGVLVIWVILDEGHIATIAVHPDVRHRGIGRKLLQTGMDAASAEGVTTFHLEVRAGNFAAQKMYEGFGFTVVGRRSKYYKDNGEDALLMTLKAGEPEEL